MRPRLDPAWLDTQYNNRARVPDHAAVLAGWSEASALARARSPARLDLPYGHGAGETLDVFPATASRPAAAPVLVFIHGGYWRSLDKADHSFVAPSFNAAGAVVVVPNYALCPAVSIEHIVLQMAAAVAWTWRHAADFGGDPARIALAGHSAGAQFVHRYLMYVPEARVGRVIAANAGWYTMPVRDVAFPYGLAGSGVDDAALRRALQRPLTVMLGTADNDPQHESLRRTPEAQAQGPHRLARGEAFVAAGRRAAAERGIASGWTLQRVDGVVHDNAGMAGPAAELLAPPR